MNPENQSPETRICPDCGHQYQRGLSGHLSTGCPKCLARFLDDETHADPETGEEAEVLKPGDSLAGMEILEILGRGGMGVVYKARQTHLNRVVALKVLNARLAKDGEFTRRFGREAKAMAALNHPNIVHVDDSGREGDRLFLVMEYVEGTTLRQILTTGRVEPDAALRYIPQICDALEYAHGCGVIHRDIKPENILIDLMGNLKIADFGLAKMAAQAGSQSRMVTAVDRVMGTPNYMAPEQMKPSGAVDHRADIYSLGVVFYEMVTGELPLGHFPMPSQRVQVDASWDDVVIKALNQNPDLRYQKVSQIKQEVSGEVPTTSAARQPVREPAAGEGALDFRRLARFAAICLPWGLPLLWEIARNGSAQSVLQTDFHQSGIYRFFLMPLGILTAITGTFAGWMALKRSSGGSKGRWLAWTIALAYPVTIFVLLLGVLPLLLRTMAGPLSVVLAGVVVFVLIATALFTIRHKPRALYVAGVIATIFLIIGGERLIAWSADHREARNDYLILFRAFGRAALSMEEDVPSEDMQFDIGTKLQEEEMSIGDRLDRLASNRIGMTYLESLDHQYEILIWRTEDGGVVKSSDDDMLMIWVDPDRQGLSFLLRNDRRNFHWGIGAPDSMTIFDLAISDDHLIVQYLFSYKADPKNPDFLEKEPNRPYKVRIPLEAIGKGGDSYEWWKRGEARN